MHGIRLCWMNTYKISWLHFQKLITYEFPAMYAPLKIGKLKARICSPWKPVLSFNSSFIQGRWKLFTKHDYLHMIGTCPQAMYFLPLGQHLYEAYRFCIYLIFYQNITDVLVLPVSNIIMSSSSKSDICCICLNIQIFKLLSCSFTH